VNGYNVGLLTNNPNFGITARAANPFRLDRSQILLTDQDNGYTAEPMGYDAGLWTLFHFPWEQPGRRPIRRLAP
jgi:phospholipase C